jgi:hypothetical protein
MLKMKNKKISILLLTCKDYPFDLMEDCIRNTWGKEKNENVNIWYYYGGFSNFNIEGDKIQCTSLEGYENIGKKTLEAFEFLLDTDFDYLFRPNSSSFVNIKKLQEFLNSCPSEKFYAGSIIPYETYDKNINEEFKNECVSGCGYILSRDLVKYIVENKNMWEHDIIDDIALCVFLAKNNIFAKDVFRLKLHYSLFDKNTNLNERMKELIYNTFHITIRSSEVGVPWNEYRIKNCEIIKELYDIIYNDKKI